MKSYVLICVGIIGVLWLSIIFFMSFLPFYSRKNMLFGIAIPMEEVSNKFVQKLKKRFTLISLVLGFIFFLVGIVLCIVFKNNKIFTAIIVNIILISFYVCISIVLGVFCYKSAKKYKLYSDWDIESKSYAIIKEDNTTKKRISSWLYLIYLIPIAVMIVITVLKYNDLPFQIPVTYDLNGNIVRLVDKNINIFVLMPILSAITGFIIFGVHLLMKNIKRQANIVASSRLSKYLNILIYQIGLLIQCLFLCIQLFLLMLIDNFIFTILLLVFIFIIVLSIFVFIIMSVKIKKSTPKNHVNNKKAEQDEYWKFGVFYVNSKDSSILVEKRLGSGYTLNFGNPISIVVSLIFVAVVVLMIVLPFVL